MRSYLNSGHDISNAEDMKLAMESNGGVRGVATVLCGLLTIPDPDPFPKWEGVSLINDIEFDKEKMKVWRAYQVGDGKNLPYSGFPLKEITELPSLNKTSDVLGSDLLFSDVTPRQHHVIRGKDKAISSTKDSSDTDDDTLFTCPEDGCVKSFQKFSSLQKHLDGERHKYTLERESLLDMAMLRYAENLESGTASIEEHHEAITSEELVEVPSAKMGWALKRTATSRRLNEKQKNYLSDLFHFGEETGRKADASDVSKSMRKARNADGSFLFKSDEYLTSLQITGFFSRLSAKKSIQVPSTSNLTDDDDDQDDVLSAMAEKDLEKMRHDVMNEISI